MTEVVFPALIDEAGKRRTFGAGLLADVAKPVRPDPGGVRRNGPDRPEVRCGPQLELLGGKYADPLGQTLIRESPAVVEAGDSSRSLLHVCQCLSTREMRVRASLIACPSMSLLKYTKISSPRSCQSMMRSAHGCRACSPYP